MFCMKCQNDLVDCICPDLEERLRSVEQGGRVLLPWEKLIEANKINRLAKEMETGPAKKP